jgi:hypothetical protein
MNMQTIQITILLLDGFIKLAPWRIVTQAIGRIGYDSGRSLAYSLRPASAVSAALCLIAVASIFGPALLAGYFVGLTPSHVSRGGLALGYAVPGPYLGVMLCGWGSCFRSQSCRKERRGVFHA